MVLQAAARPCWQRPLPMNVRPTSSPSRCGAEGRMEGRGGEERGEGEGGREVGRERKRGEGGRGERGRKRTLLVEAIANDCQANFISIKVW